MLHSSTNIKIVLDHTTCIHAIMFFGDMAVVFYVLFSYPTMGKVREATPVVVWGSVFHNATPVIYNLHVTYTYVYHTCVKS